MVNPTRLLKAFSLANLILLPAWTEMAPGAGNSYYMGYSPGALAYLALGANLLFTTLVLHLGFDAVEWVPGHLGRVFRGLALYLLAGLAINGIRVSFQDQAYYFNLANQVIQLGWTKFLVLYGSPFLLLALFVYFQEVRFRRWGAFLLLVLSPLPLIQGLSVFTAKTPISILVPANGTATVRPKGIVLFMIFDEWDYTWTFPARPAGMQLPEIDRFRRENLLFTRAYAPTSETFRSIPSLLTGQIVEAARTTPGPDVLMKFRGVSGWTPWSQTPDLPYQLEQQGLRTCFVNHFHTFSPAYAQARPTMEIRRKPYFTEWEVGRTRYQSFGGSVLRQGRCVLENLPGINFLWNHEGKVESVPMVYLHALDQTLDAIRSRRFDVIITHWPIPHAPVMVDPTTGEFSAHSPKGLRLTENLRLVDKTIGKLRLALEAQGLWEDATVILTSDHWQRLAADPKQGVSPVEFGVEASQRRVPLLLKWPGAPGPRVMDQPMNGVALTGFLAAPEASRRLEQLWAGGEYLGSYSPWIR